MLHGGHGAVPTIYGRCVCRGGSSLFGRTYRRSGGLGTDGGGSGVLDREEQLGRELGREGMVPDYDGRKQFVD